MDKKILSADELKMVNGGMEIEYDPNEEERPKAKCPECGQVSTYLELMGGKRKCDNCGRVYELNAASGSNGL